ncbi:hypothetical protein VCRA2110O318_70104 [Vibrio crassostreae]|nr:hypothetical protein VCRA2117O328_80103 [Vibrio crassostreae]CAK2354788.1 hypothetical protein VCRA2110O318_70104 [Vibrio crassostreae]CAK2441022.1 hypothetical protein VCRA2110O319_10355 [Vibrio crassostreae]CAK3005907.1 hypothetical protein VCRA217O317_70104 [Vibrio crassostreae]
MLTISRKADVALLDEKLSIKKPLRQRKLQKKKSPDTEVSGLGSYSQQSGY